jgi:hypothetical protein
VSRIFFRPILKIGQSWKIENDQLSEVITTLLVSFDFDASDFPLDVAGGAIAGGAIASGDVQLLEWAISSYLGTFILTYLIN